MAWAGSVGGSSLAGIYQSMKYRPRANRPWSAEVIVPAALCPAVTDGVTELVISESGSEKFVGPCWQIEDNGDPDAVFTTLVGFDPTIKLPRRYVMDADGDLSDPSIFEDFEDAVSIFDAAMTNTIAIDGAFGVAVGSVAGGGVPLVGYRPVDWPLTMEQLRILLVDTGELDTVLVPASGGASTLNLANGDAGTDLSGSVSFDYRTGAFNCSHARYTSNMDNVVNRLRYLLGPKRPQFPGDIQHWAGDVQKDDPDLPDPPQTTIDGLIAASEAAHTILREIRIYDSNGDENDLRDLYFRLWQSEIQIRTQPRKLVTVTPMPGIVPSFGPLDIVDINANLRGGTISGPQRVYEYEVTIDAEGNGTITQLTTSADQDH